MIFIHNDLKYDTDKMEKIVEYTEYRDNIDLFAFGQIAIKCEVYRTRKGRWCRVRTGAGHKKSELEILTDYQAKDILKVRDIHTCEKYFGEFEEA